MIIIAVGILWLISGGPKSPTKDSLFIKPVATGSTASGSGWFGFLFPGFGGMNQTNNATTGSGEISLPTVKLSEYNIPGQSNIGTNPKTNTLYGADNPPGPVTNEPDTLTINYVAASYEQDDKAGNEYLTITAPETNKKALNLTGMILKSRMTGNQADIREGINVYYANALNSVEPILLKPGETASIISGRSPLGYSFKTNKCIGYLKKSNQNFVVSLPGGCPRVTAYPLPARPNQFNDACLDFLSSIGSCQTVTNYPDGLQSSCKNFVAERTNYSRCVADFGNDLNFLGKEWLIYLNHEYSLWKERREIVDLIDQRGNILSTYTY